MERGLRFSIATMTLLMASCLFFSHSVRADEAALCDLHVEMVGLKSDQGEVIVALFSDADSFDQGRPAFRSEHSSISGLQTSAAFDALPCGQYALMIFHDENINGKLDTNFVGFPKESFGFSNDAMGSFGPPSFEAARFEISDPRHQLTIHLK